MWLQLFLFVLALVVCNNYKMQGDNEYSRHKYMTFLIVVLVLQSALRHLGVGEDTYSYYEEWNYNTSQSWSAILRNFYNVYALGVGKDPGYAIILKLLSYIIPSFRVFLFVYAVLLFIPICRLAEENLHSLKQLYLFFCLYQVMFYSYFSVTGIRQGIATMIAFYAIAFVKKKKLAPFLIVIALASFIHRSVLLFVPFYFMYYFKKSRLSLIISLLVLPAMFVLARPLAGFMVDVSGAEQYRVYAESKMETGGAANFLILLLTIAISTLIAKTKNEESIPDFVANSTAVAVIFAPLMWVDTSLMRVIQYFSIFALIGMPLAIDNLFSRGTNNTLYWLFWIVLVLTTIRHNYEYCFFWQDMQLPSVYL